MTILYHSEDSVKASKTLEGQGIKLPTSPAFEAPTLPSDISSVSDEDLMELYSQLVAYLDYITVQVAVAEVDEQSCEKRLERLRAEKMGTVSEKTVSAAKAKVASEPSVVVLSKEYDDLYSYRKIVEAVHQNIDRNVSLVSRELTRRTSTGKRWN